MNAKLLIGSFILLFIVSSCNRRYSSRNYIKSGHTESSSERPTDKNKTETSQLTFPELPASVEEQEEMLDLSLVDSLEPAPALQNSRIKTESQHRLIKNASRVIRKEIKNQTNVPNSDDEPEKSKKNMAIASMVLGIASILFMLVLPMLGIPMAILAIVFGAIAMKDPEHRGKAIAGLVTGIVALLLVFFVILLLMALIII